MYFDEASKTFNVDELGFKPETIDGIWSLMPNWQVEVDWKAELSPENPRWCKVWDGDIEAFLYAKISTYNKGVEYPFIKLAMLGGIWKFATPVSDALAALLDAEVNN
ncbi:MAG: hypothetical protein KUG64_10875 [Cycloclasticus sp.]|nr:hypothetical protein [Cycloclasticus sp.]